MKNLNTAFVVSLLLFIVLSATGIFAAESQALLIGYSSFDDSRAGALPSVETDITNIREVLVKNGYRVAFHRPEKGLQYDGDTEFVAVTPNQNREDEISTKETLLLKSSILAFLKSLPAETKKVVIYISTHGAVSKNDGFICAVTDTIPSETKTTRDGFTEFDKITGLSYNWLFNEVKKTPYDVILIFDTCHASEGNVPDLSKYLSQGKKAAGNRVVVLTRCRREQSAGVTTDYSYWISLGLRGFADVQSVDGEVDTNELHQFLLERFQLDISRENPMKFVLGAAQNPKLASVVPVSQEELIKALAAEIDSELRQATDKILGTSEKSQRKICVLVPEFLPTAYAFQMGNNFETTRKQLAIQLAKHLEVLSRQSNVYHVIKLEALQDKAGISSNDRNILEKMSHLDEAPFVWINGTIEPFDEAKAKEELNTKSISIIGKYAESTLHINCSLHHGDRSYPLSRWGGLMNYVVQNLDEHIESYPVSVAPQLLEGLDEDDPAMFLPVTLNMISEEVARPPAERTDPLKNPLLEPMILVKKPDAPPLKNNPSSEEFSVYLSQNYQRRKLTFTDDNNLQVDLDTDEEFIIALNVRKAPENISNKPNPKEKKPYLFARVLIDGRNTIAQAVPKMEDFFVPDNYQTEFRTAESVAVRNAEPWYIALDGVPVVIPGFVSMKDRFPRAFMMTDEAVRDKEGKTISDYTGLIQIIAYLPTLPSPHRGVVMPGDQIPCPINTMDTPYLPGDMVGAWVIQYGK